MTKSSIRIVKVPLPENEKMSTKPQVFPKMPRLYLELLENKSKIKQDLINKDYVPDSFDSKVDSLLNNEKPEADDYDSDIDEKPKPVEVVDDSDDDKKKYETDDDKKRDHSDVEVSDDDEPPPVQKKKYDTDDDDESVKSAKRSSSSADDLSNRLKELLKDDKEDKKQSDDSRFARKDKYSRRRNDNNNPPQPPPSYNQPPKLSEIDSGNFNKEYRNIAYEQDDNDDAKRELMFKMELLKKSYPHAVIQEFSIHSDYSNMKKTYDSTVRRLSLDSTVENYKTYLIGGFMVTEYILGNFLGFDMQGFTQQQIISMNNYEKLLIELGEKSYVPEGSQWPVEVRLLGMIIIQAALFIISRMIMKKTGSNLLGMINNMNINTANRQTTAKRKMKGPSINLDEMPDINQPADNNV